MLCFLLEGDEVALNGEGAMGLYLWRWGSLGRVIGPWWMIGGHFALTGRIR